MARGGILTAAADGFRMTAAQRVGPYDLDGVG